MYSLRANVSSASYKPFNKPTYYQDGKQFRPNRSGRRDGEKLQYEGSTPRMNRLEIKEVDYLRFKITQAEVQPTMNIRPTSQKDRC
jgi:hypothetical protein